MSILGPVQGLRCGFQNLGVSYGVFCQELRVVVRRLKQANHGFKFFVALRGQVNYPREVIRGKNDFLGFL